MAYLWKIRDSYPEALLGEYRRDIGPDRFVFKQGKPLVTLPSQRPIVEFATSMSKLRRLHDLGNNALVPLVSPMVADLLREVCPEDVQLLETRVSCQDGVMDDYSLVVVTNAIRGLNHEESSYKCIPNTDAIMRFHRAVYLDGCLGVHDVARDEEYLSNLLVSDRLFERLRGFGGLGLYAPSDMT